MNNSRKHISFYLKINDRKLYANLTMWQKLHSTGFAKICIIIQVSEPPRNVMLNLSNIITECAQSL